MKKTRFKLGHIALAAALTVTLAAPLAASAAGTQTGTEVVAMPEQKWQKTASFPDQAGYVDDTLAMNSLMSFTCFRGQGDLYITVAEGVTGFRVFLNNQEIDIKSLAAGKSYKLDVSGLTVDGINTLQVSNIAPATAEKAVTVSVGYPTVISGAAADVEISAEALNLIDSIIKNDIDNGFTAAQLAIVKDGKLVKSSAYGVVNSYNQDGTPNTDSKAVTTETLFDLASNTKMYAANYAVQKLVSEGKMSVSDPVTKYFPDFDKQSTDTTQVREWKGELKVQDILQHQAGFNPDPQYHNDQFNQETQKPEQGVANPLFSQDKATTEKMIMKTPLVYEPGTKTVYSDVDYMLLGLIVEKVSGQNLDVYLKENIYGPMGLTHVTYNPLKNGFEKDDCAATELNGNSRDGVISFKNIRDYTLQGEVHDEKAFYAMSGVSGHAGLFSNAEDLAKLCQIMLNGGGYGENMFFDKGTVEIFTRRKEAMDNWGLGWWRQGDGKRPWYFGVQAPSTTIGHQGWTGTLTMIDPENDLIVVYLTNKINSPVTDKTANANKFDGNWYTSATLGFVANILYQGMGDKVNPEALDALLADMVTDKFRLVAGTEGATADHPIVKSAYALVDTAFDWADMRGTAQAKAYAKQALAKLDPSRDSAKIAELTVRLVGGTAQPNPAVISVDGKNVSFEAYNMNSTTYLKLRDVAAAVNGTKAQFDVKWDGSVVISTGAAYTPEGGELESKNTGAQTVKASAAAISVDGETVALEAYVINGNTYFKLRDLGKTLGFNVSYDAAAQTILVDTTVPYAG